MHVCRRYEPCTDLCRSCSLLLQAIPGGPKPAPGVNVILDLVGASHFGGNLESLAVEGKLLLVGLPSGSKAEINLALVHPLATAVVTPVLCMLPCYAVCIVLVSASAWWGIKTCNYFLLTFL